MSLENLIENYKPSEDAAQIIKSYKIALLVGISGAGKDTIKKGLLDLGGFGEIVSHTTRQPRENGGVLENNGVDYHFIDNTEAERMLEAGEFFEAKLVHGTVYGTAVAQIRQAAEQGVAITDVDVQGVAEYKAVSDNVVAIFVIPPSYEEWVRRLRLRYSSEADFQAEWPKRRNSAISELQKALEFPYYHCLINDDLGRAVTVASEIALRDDIFNRKDDEARLVARDLLDKILTTS